MVQNSSWEDDSPLFDPILSHTNTFVTLISWFFNVYWKKSFHLSLGLSSGLFLSLLPTKIVYAFISPTCTARNVTAKWLAFLRICEGLGSDLCRETFCLDWGFCGFPQSSKQMLGDLNSTVISSVHIIYSHSIIWATSLMLDKKGFSQYELRLT
jgi:hypothetical protein